MPDPHSHTDRAASFEQGADVYAATRPPYPDEAVDWLLPDSAGTVLDLAAGTGKLTSALVARGLTVHAVEPSQAMLGHLQAALPGVHAHVGTAERIPLPDDAVDGVVVGQAWHWFQRGAVAEIARVLRPGGRLGVVWNTRDHTVGWVRRFGEILHRGDELNPTESNAAPVLGATPADGHAGESPFGAVESAAFRWKHRLPTSALRPLAASRSYLIALPADRREELLAEVDALVATHPDLAGRDETELPYVAECYRADVAR